MAIYVRVAFIKNLTKWETESEDKMVIKASEYNKCKKFMVGDRIVAIKEFSNFAFRKGAEAIVESLPHKPNYTDEGFEIEIRWIRNGLDQGQMHGGYNPNWFELITDNCEVKDMKIKAWNKVLRMEFDVAEINFEKRTITTYDKQVKESHDFVLGNGITMIDHGTNTVRMLDCSFDLVDLNLVK